MVRHKQQLTDGPVPTSTAIGGKRFAAHKVEISPSFEVGVMAWFVRMALLRAQARFLEWKKQLDDDNERRRKQVRRGEVLIGVRVSSASASAQVVSRRAHRRKSPSAKQPKWKENGQKILCLLGFGLRETFAPILSLPSFPLTEYVTSRASMASVKAAVKIKQFKQPKEAVCASCFSFPSSLPPRYPTHFSPSHRTSTCTSSATNRAGLRQDQEAAAGQDGSDSDSSLLASGDEKDEKEAVVYTSHPTPRRRPGPCFGASVARGHSLQRASTRLCPRCPQEKTVPRRLDCDV